MNDKFFPTLMIALSLVASGIYFVNGDIRRGWYWFFAAAITVTVTY